MCALAILALVSALTGMRALRIAAVIGSVALAIVTLVVALDPPQRETFGLGFGPGVVVAFGSLVLIAAAALLDRHSSGHLAADSADN